MLCLALIVQEHIPSKIVIMREARLLKWITLYVECHLFFYLYLHRKDYKDWWSTVLYYQSMVYVRSCYVNLFNAFKNNRKWFVGKMVFVTEELTRSWKVWRWLHENMSLFGADLSSISFLFSLIFSFPHNRLFTPARLRLSFRTTE